MIVFVFISYEPFCLVTPLPPHLWLVPFFHVESKGSKILLVCFSFAAWYIGRTYVFPNEEKKGGKIFD